LKQHSGKWNSRWLGVGASNAETEVYAMREGYDLVVVGAGTAGIPCAVEAAGAGAKVLLIDKAPEVGGTLHVSGGHLSAAGTRRQAERKISDDPDAHYADVMRISRQTARQDLTRLAVDLAGPTIDWLADNGFEFTPESPRLVYGHEPYTTPRTYYGPDAALSILSVLRRLLAEAVDGGAVELRLSTAVRSLVIDGDRCVGVRLAGQAEPVAAAHVVLATGGFGFAPDLFAELEGAPLVTSAYPTSTGDGMRIARDAGAGLQGRGTYLPTFGGLPPEDGVRVVWEERPLLVATERPPYEIYVDRRGRRWVAEDEVSIDDKERALVGIEDMTFWMVFDARALRESRPMVVGWEPAELPERANRRIGISADATLDGLARRAGIEPAGLADTVSRYNAAVQAGEDPDFGRRYLPATIAEPPFYAVQNHALTLITFTGVDTDGELRVRRQDGSVIGGLYAVGEVVGAGATSGNSFCGGMLLTPALAFGRHVGRRIGAGLTGVGLMAVAARP
jgi:hypothetical protein